ncbi:MAG TPA: methyltransferase domain-containing protein, partial [Candidatus Kapabacteria bacterium]|nr:methyltransferase domain-containing protein [Candidatus Kapabacteria bacterium]
MKKSTSWGNVAAWYTNLLEKGKGTYQHDVILPNLLRILSLRPGMNVLDLACGSGFFARAFARAGARVMGIDISPELIRIAEQYAKKEPTLA